MSRSVVMSGFVVLVVINYNYFQLISPFDGSWLLP